MKLKKMIGVSLAAAALAASLAPAFPAAADDITVVDGFTLFQGRVEGYNGPGGSVAVPEGAVSIDYSLFGLGDGAKITSVRIPASISEIDPCAFAGADQLTYIGVDPKNPDYSSPCGVLFDKRTETLVKYPAGRKDKSYKVPAGTAAIAYEAFREAPITAVSLPAGLKTVAENAFYFCDLRSVSLPAGLTSVGKDAFYANEHLAKIGVPQSLASVGADAFKECHGGVTGPATFYGGSRASALADEYGREYFAQFAWCSGSVGDSKNPRFGDFRCTDDKWSFTITAYGSPAGRIAFSVPHGTTRKLAVRGYNGAMLTEVFSY